MFKRIQYVIVWLLPCVGNREATAQMLMPDTVCVGSTRTYTVNPGSPSGSIYKWWINGVLQGEFKNAIKVTWPTAGKFNVEVQENSGGCDGNVQAGMVVVNAMRSARYPTMSATLNLPLQLQARIFAPGDQYTWLPAVGLNSYIIGNPVFRYNITTEYRVSIAARTGCNVVDTVLVKVIPESYTPPSTSAVFVPKAFSPNGDGHNDKLVPLLVRIKVLYYFRVFNRWGQLVYETNTPGEGWDGTLKGILAVPDIYTWTVAGLGADGRTHNMRGQTLLFR